MKRMAVERRHHRRNYNDPGHTHELTFSCYKGYKFMKAERTCQWLAEAVKDARVEWNFTLWAYVFMPEHVHLIVHPRNAEYDIADIRKAIKSPVGRKGIRFVKEKAPHWLPKVTRKRGKKTERLFWQSGGGYDRNVIEPGTLMEMINYIHMNPVRRELVKKPEEWKCRVRLGTRMVEKCRLLLIPFRRNGWLESNNAVFVEWPLCGGWLGSSISESPSFT